MSFLAALQTEIEELEASLRANPDPRLVKIQELRRVQSLYTTGASPSASAAKPNSTEPRGNRSGRQPSPERVMALAKASEFLKGKTEPVKTVDILNHLFDQGVMVNGASPVSNLSAMLYHSPDFQSHGRQGWTLKALDIAAIMGPSPSEDTVRNLPGYRPTPENPVDAKPSEETSTGFDQPTNEHSREAMQGGGA